MISGVPTPQRIVGYTLTITFFIVAILGLARNFRGDIDEGSSTLRTHSHFASPHQPLKEIMLGPIEPTKGGEKDGGIGPEKLTSDSYYVFLQKFPLENSWKSLFHTEVIVCPRETFTKDSTFLNMLDGLVDTLAPSRFDDNGVVDGDSVVQDTTKSPFVAIEEDQWSKQSDTGCTQLGYGGANCSGSCCGSPHLPHNRNYALNSTTAVISNAMGEYKELYFYGRSSATPGTATAGVSAISGDDAYKAVCHGHMNAIEMGSEPMCVSNWAGRDYNPLTNNCNTFTSAVLKCVYGFSDAKPHLGVSDLRSVTCPTETTADGKQVEQCLIPGFEVEGGDDTAVE